jgi:hypothetical protein
LVRTGGQHTWKLSSILRQRNTQTHRSKTMTPYELRFEIFKQAYAHANDEYFASYNIVDNHNQTTESKWDYPTFPSYEKIESLADKINNFVSSK